MHLYLPDAIDNSPLLSQWLLFLHTIHNVGTIRSALEGNGFKIMLLLRLSPLIPYNALDYISGVTSISFRQYALALLGIVPGAVTLCYIGATASSLTDGTSYAGSHQAFHTAVLIAGIVFAVAGGAVASYYSKIELDKIILESGGGSRADFVPLETMPRPIVATIISADQNEAEAELSPVLSSPESSLHRYHDIPSAPSTTAWT
jgi:SNARE associated Golgi protein